MICMHMLLLLPTRAALEDMTPPRASVQAQQAASATRSDPSTVHFEFQYSGLYENDNEEIGDPDASIKILERVSKPNEDTSSQLTLAIDGKSCTASWDADH